MSISSPLKWHGGKNYLAARIVDLMPPRKTAANPDGWLHFVEPFAGSLAVLLANDPEGISEVVNDLNGDLTNFWMVLRDDGLFTRFQRFCEATPFCETGWHDAMCVLHNPDLGAGNAGDGHYEITRAWCFFVACRQSLAGRMDSFAPLSRTRTRRGMNEQASAWLNAVEGLPAVHARLKRVVILNRDALDVIRQQDGPQTLYYLDPPYLHETRATTGEYAHEMTEAQHRALLELLAGIQGKFLLSGYASPLYDSFATAHGWKRHDFELPNNAASGESKRRMVETIWCNYEVQS